jgi:carbamoyl-phosphate synthase large subunit
MVQAFRDPELGLRVTDVNVRFGGGYPSHMYGALAGQTYPELVIRLAAGERIAPHVGDFRAGVTFARYYWQLELDERLELTGREIVDGGLPRPRR